MPRNASARYGLLARDVAQLKATLAPYARQIERVGIFGSRSSGDAKPGSDVDLVLFGPVSQRVVDRLWTAFDESSISVAVDVVAYKLIEHDALRAQIDATAATLFTQSELENQQNLSHQN